MSNNSIEVKRKREQNMVNQMIKLYCKKNHNDQNADGLCDECRNLLEYSQKRSEKCPFMETKTFCAFCKTHCYSPTRREEIRAVMRYSGPRMMLTAPVATLHHLYLSILHKLKSSNHKD